MKIARAIGGFVLSFGFLIFFVYAIYGVKVVFGDSLQSQDKNVFLSSVSDTKSILPESAVGDLVKLIAPVEINARAAISVETNFGDTDKIIFDKNSHMPLPIASLTKLMTAVVVLGNYNLSDTITVDELADAQDPIKQDVKLGDTFPVESFLDIMLVGSSNKSAYALAELISVQKFVGLMNQVAKNLGMEDTFFADPTGLSPQNVSTASDLIKLTEYILKNYPKIGEISSTKEFYVPMFGRVANTDQLLGDVPDIVFSKTGFTPEANGCLLLVTRKTNDESYLISVVLGADDRFVEMKKLINFSGLAHN